MKGLSGLRGNSYGPFLGGWVGVILPGYPIGRARGQRRSRYHQPVGHQVQPATRRSVPPSLSNSPRARPATLNPGETSQTQPSLILSRLSSPRIAALCLVRAATAGHCCMLGALPSPRARGDCRRATLECSKGVFGGCAPEGTALKWPLFYLSAFPLSIYYSGPGIKAIDTPVSSRISMATSADAS